MLRLGRLVIRSEDPGHVGVDRGRGRRPDRRNRRPNRPAPGPGALRCGGMPHRTGLVAASALQLAAGLAGQVVALRRRRHYDIPFMAGSPDRVARDSWWFGTAFSAPSYMLATQTWAI